MKALGRGPITRLASAAVGARGAVYNRDDWSAGRDTAAEERRCGMVVRLSDTAAAATSGSAAAGASNALTPLLAVVRAQTTDAQVSEVGADGQGAFLEKSPRARWRKISRAKTLLVEDTATPFSNPEKSFAPRVQSYGEYVRRLGRLPDGQPLLRFVLYRDGYSLDAVRHRFQYEIGVPADALYFHTPPGGSFAAVSQFGVAVGVTREQLPHAARRYNVHPFILDPRDYHSLAELSQLTAPASAYVHRLVLRCVPAEEEAVMARLQRLRSVGFVNYFGMEHFGLGSNTLFDLAAAQHGGDVHHAVGGYLQTLAESNPLHYDAYLAYANAEPGTVTGVLEEWVRLCERAKLPRATRNMLRDLSHYHQQVLAQRAAVRADNSNNNNEVSSGVAGLDTVAAAALQRVWDDCSVADKTDFSASAFVWNAMAAQRLLSYGNKVVRGDLVRCAGPHGTPHIAEVASEEEAAAYSMEDVVLPVPQKQTRSMVFPSHNVDRALYEAFAARHHLSFLFGESESRSPLSSAPTATSSTRDDSTAKAAAVEYRNVVRRPDRMQAAVLRDPASCTTMKSDYFLLQEHLPTASESLDYERRVREPSPFNVSERFREKMDFVRQHHPGENTVVLSLSLPAEASPWVALREVFDLRYGSFHDLYGIS